MFSSYFIFSDKGLKQFLKLSVNEFMFNLSEPY